MKALGANVVLTTEDLAALPGLVKEATGGHFAHGAINCVAGDISKALAQAVRPGGTVIQYGAMGGIDFTASMMDLIFRDTR